MTMSKGVVLDIETDALDATQIHCMVARDVKTDEVTEFIQEECYTKFPQWSKSIDKFYMHNGISFDGRIINKLTDADLPMDNIIDTLILSQLFNPIRDKGHSLAAWGDRLGFPKDPPPQDFSLYTDHMLQYCNRDVDVTFKLLKRLVSEGSEFSSKSIKLEHKIRELINQQEDDGFYLDEQQAMTLMNRFQDECSELDKQLEESFPTTVTKRFHKTTGRPLLDHIDKFNPSSRQQIAEKLMAKGWIPQLKTDKGNIIVSDEILSTLDIPEAKVIARYLLLEKRVSQIKQWIAAVDNYGRVHGRVMTLKTITGRMAHNTPNMAQVPAVYSPYGKECRSCWTVSDPDNYSLVGTDASGLEIRALAHYMGDKDYIKEVIEGDIHTANQKMANLATRDQAKTFLYALIYGAGAEKIGKVAGVRSSDGQKLIDNFLRNVPALKQLRSRIDIAAKKKIIPGIDGRKLHVRSFHSALNTLIQGAGAVICKQWLVQMMEHAKDLDVRLVASIHDEYQFEVHNKDVKEFCSITKKAMKETQEILNVKCPLDNEFKVGTTWADTH